MGSWTAAWNTQSTGRISRERKTNALNSWNHNTHHLHHHMASPCRSIAVSTIWRQRARSCAECQAAHNPMFCCRRSCSTVHSHVCRGRPRGRLHFFSGSSVPTPALKTENVLFVWGCGALWLFGLIAFILSIVAYLFTYLFVVTVYVGVSGRGVWQQELARNRHCTASYTGHLWTRCSRRHTRHSGYIIIYISMFMLICNRSHAGHF